MSFISTRIIHSSLVDYLIHNRATHGQNVGIMDDIVHRWMNNRDEVLITPPALGWAIGSRNCSNRPRRVVGQRKSVQLTVDGGDRLCRWSLKETRTHNGNETGFQWWSGRVSESANFVRDLASKSAFMQQEQVVSFRNHQHRQASPISTLVG